MDKSIKPDLLDRVFPEHIVSEEPAIKSSPLRTAAQIALERHGIENIQEAEIAENTWSD